MLEGTRTLSAPIRRIRTTHPDMPWTCRPFTVMLDVQVVYPEIFFKWNIFMKRTLFFALTVLVLIGCKGGEKTDPSNTADANIFDKDTSYALGIDFGTNFGSSGIQFDYKSFIQGLGDVLEGKKTKITPEEAAEKVQTAYLALMNKQTEPFRQIEALFLEENAKKEGVKVTDSGLQYEVISEGTGARPQPTDTVKVNYEGTLTNGNVFDSSYSRGEPVEFPLNQVIPGWTEGIQLMSEGSNYRFYIPSGLAYGDNGISGVIPPFSTLIFEVELISISE
jgi:FKBP-type peptidyl-prolyl cis-trans isomerase FkpA